MASQPAMSANVADVEGSALTATQMEIGETTATGIATSNPEGLTKSTAQTSVVSNTEEQKTPEHINETVEPALSRSDMQTAEHNMTREQEDGKEPEKSTLATTKIDTSELQASIKQPASASETAPMLKSQKSSPPPAAADITRRTLSPAPPAVTAQPVEVKTQQSDAVVGSPAQSTLLDSVMSASSNTTPSLAGGEDHIPQPESNQGGQLPIHRSSHPAPWSPTLSGSTPTFNTAGPSSSSTTLPPQSPASLPGNSPPFRLLQNHHHQQQQQHQAGPSRRAATTTGIPTHPQPPHHKQHPSTSSMTANNPNSPPFPITPTLPSTSSALPTAEARDAIIASMSNLLDHKLQSRASQLHANSAALTKQENDVIRATDSLRKETDKLEKVARDAGKKVKELGNVQNWAEVLERDLLVIEETIRLANARRGGGDGDEDEEGSERCSECQGSCCWSGSDSGSGSGSDDEDDDHEEGGGRNNGERRTRRGGGGEREEAELGNDDGGPSMMKFGGVNVEINDDLLASLSEAMRLDIYEDDKHDANSFGDPTDSGISVATPTSSESLDRSQGTPSQGNSSIDSRLEPV